MIRFTMALLIEKIGTKFALFLLEPYLKDLETDLLVRSLISMGIPIFHWAHIIKKIKRKSINFYFYVTHREPYLNDPLVVSVLNVVKLRSKVMDLCLLSTTNHRVSKFIY